jgi:Electron transfer DM13
MKTWIKVTIPVDAVALLVAWYAFRPERLVVNRSVNEAMPNAPGTSSAQPLESGRFYSTLHPTEGAATIYQMADGTRVLRFTSFSTSNGPDVHVYMVAADDAKDVATVQKAGFVDLGVIKGNIGDQNYTLGEIPRSVHMVQTIQREFRSRGAKIDRGIAKSLGHGFVIPGGARGDTMELWAMGAIALSVFYSNCMVAPLIPGFSREFA